MKASLMRSARNGIAAILAMAMLAAAPCLQGCGEEGKNAVNYSQRSEADQRWLQGTDAPPTPRTLHAMAKIFAAQRREAEATYVLNKVMQEYPDFLPAYVEMAELHMRARRVDAAIEMLNKGLKVAPKDAVLLNNIGMCYMIKGDCENALARFSEAAAAAPENVRYRANVAAALGMAGKYEEAFAVYQQLLTPADAHYNIGVLCETRGDKDKAAMHFAEAERLRALAEESKGKVPGVEVELPPKPPAE